MVETDKFDRMISAFAADFSLALDGSRDLNELMSILKNVSIPDERREKLVSDIHLLNELECLIRHNKAKIMIKE